MLHEKLAAIQQPVFDQREEDLADGGILLNTAAVGDSESPVSVLVTLCLALVVLRDALLDRWITYTRLAIATPYMLVSTHTLV